MELKRVSKDYDGEEDSEGIICASISADGKWIIYSTVLGVNLFQFIHDDDTPNLVKVDDLEHREIPCLRAVFTPDNLQLVTYSNAGSLYFYKLLDGRASIQQVIDVSDLIDCVTFLLVSSCGKYLIVADTTSNILVFVWNQKKNEWFNHCKLPKYKNPPTSMNIHPLTSNLVVVYSDSKIVEYDVSKKHFTQFSRNLENSNWKSRAYPIRNVTFDPRSEDVIILQDDSNIIVINKDKKLSGKKSPKSKLVKLGSGKDGEELGMSSIKKYKHLVHLDWLDVDEMVAVEVNPISIIEKLPPAFVQNTFGKK